VIQQIRGIVPIKQNVAALVGAGVKATVVLVGVLILVQLVLKTNHGIVLLKQNVILLEENGAEMKFMVGVLIFVQLVMLVNHGIAMI